MEGGSGADMCVGSVDQNHGGDDVNMSVLTAARSAWFCNNCF